MSNETRHPTCLVALRQEISDLETRLKNRVEQVEQAFSSLGWETDQLRSNQQSADKDATLLQESNASLNARIGNLQETNAALGSRLDKAQIAYRELVRGDNEVLAKHVAQIKDLQVRLQSEQTRNELLANELATQTKINADMYTPAQVAEQVNTVHDEVMEKLSAERKELETVQLLLKQAREERDAARSERDLARNAGQQAINERDKAQTNLRNMRTVCQAQKGHIDELRSVGPALDILADMVKETQEKLEAAHTQRDDLDKDYGKLVGEYEDLSKLYDLLRNLIMDPNLPNIDRYNAFARAMRIGRHEAKTAIHRLVTDHPVCVELQRQLDIMIKRTEIERTLRPGEVLIERLTKAEALHQFKEQAFTLLQCIMNLTTKDISALQYGPHHGHQRLYKHIQAFNRKFAPCFGEREVLRDNEG